LAARLNTNGTLDTSFNGTGKQSFSFGATDRAYAVAALGDGKIVLAGSTQTSGSNPTSSFAVARLNGDGSLATSFNSTGKQPHRFALNTQGSAVAGQPDGRIVAAGTTAAIIGNTRTDFAVARFLDNGTLDPAFGTGGKQTVTVPIPGVNTPGVSPLGGMAL